MAKIVVIISIIVMSYTLFAGIINAAGGNYQLLESLPVQGLGKGQTVTFASYARGAITLGVVLAAVLTVLMLVIAGVMYISAGGNTGTTDKAKDMIWNAIIGLLIAVGFYLILYTIRPEMLKLDLGIKPYPFVKPPTTQQLNTQTLN